MNSRTPRCNPAATLDFTDFTKKCRKAISLLPLAALVLAAGCGGGGNTSATNSSPNALTIIPATAAVFTNQTQRFQANGPANKGTLTWSVNGTAGGNAATVGTINADNFGGAVYTPPAVLTLPGSITITVASSNSSVKPGTATVKLETGGPTLSSVSPANALVGSGDTQVTAQGLYFASSTTLNVNGTAVSTTVVNSDTLNATIPASMLTAPGDLLLTASTPNVSQQSGSLQFTVMNEGTVTATQNPLVANYSITAPRTAKVSVQFGPDTNYGLNTWTLPTPSGGGTVNMLVAGMRPSTTYHMRAVVTFPDGTTFLDLDHAFTTGAVDPTLIPNISINQPGPLTPNSGVELLDLLNLTGTPAGEITDEAVDLQGNLIWYYPYPVSEGFTLPIKQLSNGDMMAMIYSGGQYGTGGPGVLREFDLAGNTVRELTTDQLNSELTAAGYGSLTPVFFSHDFTVLPNGHIIVIVDTWKYNVTLTGYANPVALAGDVLIDLDQNFQPVWVWNSFSHLDINRHPTSTANDGEVFPPDWTHGNAVAYSPDDGDLVLSMRAQDWIIKIDYENGQGSGKILWRLGNQGDFTLTSGGAPAAWQYGQHYISFPEGKTAGDYELGTYDDGNNRIMDSTGTLCNPNGSPPYPCYSRAVIFDINENNMTASVAWQDIHPFFNAAFGTMQQLPNGDEEFTNGLNGYAPLSSQIDEVTRTNPPQLVWQLNATGITMYRGLRIPSLYPGVQW